MAAYLGAAEFGKALAKDAGLGIVQEAGKVGKQKVSQGMNAQEAGRETVKRKASQGSYGNEVVMKSKEVVMRGTLNGASGFAVKEAANTTLISQLGAQTVKAGVQIGQAEGGRQGVRFASNPITEAAAGASVASGGATVAGSFGLGIAATAGQMGAEWIADAAGVDDGQDVKTGKHLAGFTGAVGAGAAAGGLVVPGFGAAGGAIVGAAGYGIGEGIQALSNAVGWGPSSGNEVKVIVVDIPKGWSIDVKTFNKDDTWHAVSYDRATLSHGQWMWISAGQPETDQFKVTFWDGFFSCVWHREVHAGDCCEVRYAGGEWKVRHLCAGQWN